MANSDYILEMRHITKSFGAVVALSNGCVRAKSGEVNALIGGNGAGKEAGYRTGTRGGDDAGGESVR